MGRPIQFKSVDYIDEICEWIASGKFLTSYCAQEGKPSYTVVNRWIDQDEDISAKVARARLKGADSLVDQVIEIVDSEPDRDDNNKIDPGYIAWKKNQAWARFEAAKKINPQKYGDKQTTTHEGGISLKVFTGIPDESDD